MAANRSHVLPPPEYELPGTLHNDRHRLEEVEVPIVTVSATFRNEIAKERGEEPVILDELVFSRAHYSMAVALFSYANSNGLSVWMVDPTNYISPKDWKGLARLEKIGQLTARIPLLKKAKNIFDTFARNKSPLSTVIKGPLEYVTARAQKPIISVHYEAGNILAQIGRKVVQVVTDPHVRPNYLYQADKPNIYFAVFDQQTKEDFLDKAKKLGKIVPEKQVVVTGPPVDPRIVKARQNKNPIEFKTRGLRLVITTSGLGTNKGEIKQILEQILPNLNDTRLILYAGTHRDFREMFYSMGTQHHVLAQDIKTDAQVRVIYDESIVQANQELIEYGFPWADGFVTKPSGDMAYDAVAAGCFFLSLEPWGEWEKNIEKIFTNLGLARKTNPSYFKQQIDELTKIGWIENAIKNTLNIDPLFLNGAEKIVDLQQSLQLQ